MSAIPSAFSSTLPRLASHGIELDLSSEKFGELRRSEDVLDNVNELRARMQSDGYLFLPNYLDRDEVLAARSKMLRDLAALGCLSEDSPPSEGRIRSDQEMALRSATAQSNDALQSVLYDGAMMQFWQRFFGEDVRHFDFTWVRAVAPGQGTAPHCDIVYMGRGTQELYTAWVPLGDTTLEMGGLMMLEGSNNHQKLRANYGSKDVDAFCSNKRGDDFQEMGGGGNVRAGGTLSPDPHKLRERIGGRWLTNEFAMGDLLVFSVFTVHASLDNRSNKIRLSSDSRYQRASEPADERWIGESPIGHGAEAKRGMIC